MGGGARAKTEAAELQERFNELRARCCRGTEPRSVWREWYALGDRLKKMHRATAQTQQPMFLPSEGGGGY